MPRDEFPRVPVVVTPGSLMSLVQKVPGIHFEFSRATEVEVTLNIRRRGGSVIGEVVLRGDGTFVTIMHLGGT